jgi:hypothetical protein
VGRNSQSSASQSSPQQVVSSLPPSSSSRELMHRPSSPRCLPLMSWTLGALCVVAPDAYRCLGVMGCSLPCPPHGVILDRKHGGSDDVVLRPGASELC